MLTEEVLSLILYTRPFIATRLILALCWVAVKWATCSYRYACPKPTV